MRLSLLFCLRQRCFGRRFFIAIIYGCCVPFFLYLKSPFAKMDAARTKLEGRTNVRHPTPDSFNAL